MQTDRNVCPTLLGAEADGGVAADADEVGLQVGSVGARAGDAHGFADGSTQIHALNALQISQDATTGGQQNITRRTGEGGGRALHDSCPGILATRLSIDRL